MRTWIGAVVVLVCVGLVVWMVMDKPAPGERTPTARPVPKTEEAAARPAPRTEEEPVHTEEAVVETAVEPAKAEPAAPESDEARATGPGRITGEVLDLSGEVVAGAEVTLWEYSWEKMRAGKDCVLIDTVTTDGQGRFEFTGLPLNTYRIKAAKESQMGLEYTYLGGAAVSAHVIVILQASGIFTGTVVNAEGEGVAGASVKAAGREGERYSQVSPFTSGETDAEGAFTIPDIPKGRWRFLVTADGYAHCVTDYLAYDTQEAKFVLTKGGSLTGRAVMADTKEPVPGLTVVASTELSASTPDTTRAETGPDGTFRFDTLRAGNYSLLPDDDTFVLASGQPPRATVTEGQEASGLTIELVQGGVVTGRAYDAVSDAGVSGMRLDIYSAGGGGTVPRTDIRTDADGRYRSGALSAGTYRVMRGVIKGYVSKNTGWDDAQSALVTAGQDSTLDFPLDPAPMISGVVQDAGGKGVSGANVRAWIEGKNQNAPAETVSESGGRFELAGFPAGDTVSLRARTEKAVSDVMTGVAVVEGGVSDLVLIVDKSLDGKISGTVVDGRGQAVANANIYGRTTSVMSESSMVRCRAVSDSEGRFLIAGLPADSYAMQVSPPNSYQGGQPDADKTVIKLSEGEHKRDVRLVVSEKEGLTISGRVTSKDGKPVLNAYLNANGGGSYGYTQTDADGRYEISGLAEGSYSVYVQHQDYTQNHREEIAAGSKNVDFQLDSCGAIEGQVVDAATGKPVTDFHVGAIQGDHQVFAGWMKQQLISFHDADGKFSLPRVQAGENSVAVCASGHASLLTPLGDIRPGETKQNVRIALESGAGAAGIVIDATGQPVSGAQIFIGSAPSQWSRAGEAVTTSAADGTFEVNTLSLSDTQLSAYHEGYSQASVSISPQPGRTIDVTITLRIGARIEGLVSIGGVPAPGASVNAQTLSLFNSGGWVNASTGPDGRYVLEGLSIGECLVNAQVPMPDRPDNWRRMQRPAIVESGQVTVVDLDFPPATSVVEGVMTIAGAPVTEGNASATVQTAESEESFYAQVEGRDGFYRLGPMPAGHITARYSTQDRIKVVELDIRDGETLRQDVSFLTPATISGVVRGAVQGAREQRVVALSSEVQVPEVISPLALMAYERFVVADTAIAPDGTYTLTGIEPGVYTIGAISIPQNFLLARYALVPITVAEGDALTLDLDLMQPRSPIVVPGEQ